MEAIIGAIYLDQGYDIARYFISKNLFHLIDVIIAEKSWIDAKSKFQEKAQEKEGMTPQYKSLKEEGPDHDKRFTIGVYLDNELIAEGDGMSKQEAEQVAAKKALDVKKWF
jgi:ribonuclease III